jgi:endonuclease VIII
VVPEGHSIRRLADDLTRDLLGQTLAVSSPQGRFLDAALVDGRKLSRVEAHGKHLFCVFANRRRLHVHLGLFGKVRRYTGPAPESALRASTRLVLAGESHTFTVTGPTACELLTPTAYRALVARLGEDPLHAAPDLAVVRAAFRRRRIPVGQLLLDQSVIAGIGNVYRAEILFLCGIDPSRPARDLSDDQIAAIFETARTLLAAGVRDRRIITIAPGEIAGARSRLRRREAVYVYGRRQCRRCEAALQTVLLGGRKLAFCPGCQRG